MVGRFDDNFTSKSFGFAVGATFVGNNVGAWKVFVYFASNADGTAATVVAFNSWFDVGLTLFELNCGFAFEGEDCGFVFALIFAMSRGFGVGVMVLVGLVILAELVSELIVEVAVIGATVGIWIEAESARKGEGRIT